MGRTCDRCGKGFIPYRPTQNWCSKTCNKLAYKDRKRGGPPTHKKIKGTIEHRLMARREVDPVTGCWNWTGSTHPAGYGQVTVDGVPALAHRLSAEAFIAKRPLPTEVFVCHHCDNPRCFNPEHLFLGSAQDNTQDAVAKGRMAHGERNHNAKLKASDVPRIREAAQAGLSNRFIALAVGVDPSAIWDVVHGKSWKHVA